MNHIVVVNPACGHVSSNEKYAFLKKHFSTKDIYGMDTTSREELISVMRSLPQKSRVSVAGGDGTVLDAINTINQPLSVIPLGKFNVFSKSIQQGTLDYILSGLHYPKQKKIDLIEVNGTKTAFGGVGYFSKLIRNQEQKSRLLGYAKSNRTSGFVESYSVQLTTESTSLQEKSMYIFWSTINDVLGVPLNQKEEFSITLFPNSLGKTIRKYFSHLIFKKEFLKTYSAKKASIHLNKPAYIDLQGSTSHKVQDVQLNYISGGLILEHV